MKFKPDKKYEKKEKVFQKEGNKAYLNHEKAEIKETEKSMKKHEPKKEMEKEEKKMEHKKEERKVEHKREGKREMAKKKEGKVKGYK